MSPSNKRIELNVYTPLRKNPYPPCGYTGERLVRELGALVEKHRTTLVFCNTRSGAEATTFWLRESFPGARARRSNATTPRSSAMCAARWKTG